MSVNLAAGAALTAVLVIVAALSLVWTPFDTTKLAIAAKLQPPSAEHLLGTDQLGRDILSMVMEGAQISIAVALVSALLGVLAGIPLGLAAASRPGSLIDEIIMRGNDITFAFPAILIAILITAVFGPGAINAIIAIAIFNFPVFARLARGAALSLWQREFCLAAQVAGKSRARLSLEQLLPNIVNLIVVQGTTVFSLGITAEATLAYLGLGTQPPTPSWGRMLAEAQTLTAIAPHVAIIPGLAIVLTVLGLNLLGDGLRDALDPRLQRVRQ
ncbi:MAG: ABC transporter permease [Pseudomonadota bacterium]